jgi:hypothetical protein
VVWVDRLGYDGTALLQAPSKKHLCRRAGQQRRKQQQEQEQRWCQLQTAASCPTLQVQAGLLLLQLTHPMTANHRVYAAMGASSKSSVTHTRTHARTCAAVLPLLAATCCTTGSVSSAPQPRLAYATTATPAAAAHAARSAVSGRLGCTSICMQGSSTHAFVVLVVNTAMHIHDAD